MRFFMSLFARICASAFVLAITAYVVGYTIGLGVGFVFPLGA